MNYQEFSQKIKAKYPGAYDDVDDRVLAEKMVEKFPQYSDVTFDEVKKETLLDKAVEGGKAALKGSFPETLRKAGQFGEDVVNRAGEMTAEELAERGVNPNVAAATGLAVTMAPDIASMGMPAGPGIRGAKFLQSGAKEFGRRALGLSKAQLKTPLARGQAAKAAEVALEENILPWLGNRDVMKARALALGSREGAALGKMRDSVGKVEISTFTDGLKSLKKELVQGRSGGAWDKIGSKMDEAIETIQGLGKKKTTLKEVAEAKKVFADTVNWLSDNSSQSVTKKVTSRIAKDIERTIGAKGGDVNKYRTHNLKYGASQKMLEGIDNAMSAEAGNNLFGPIASMTGAITGVTGGAPAGIAALTLTELLKRRGSSAVARLLNAANGGLKVGGEFTSPLIGLISEIAARNTNR